RIPRRGPSPGGREDRRRAGPRRAGRSHLPNGGRGGQAGGPGPVQRGPAREGAGAGGDVLSVAFVTGGSGTVGRALISRLGEDGTRLLALAGSRQAAGVVESVGAEPFWGDLERPEGWAPEARAADRVWHLG